MSYPRRKATQPRLLPTTAPIREGDALSFSDLTTRYRCRCGNTAETGIRPRRHNLYPLRFCNEGASMTTRTQAERVLFNVKTLRVNTKISIEKPERRRVCATYCPSCGGWVEVRLQPVRLHCTGCGLEEVTL